MPRCSTCDKPVIEEGSRLRPAGRCLHAKCANHALCGGVASACTGVSSCKCWLMDRVCVEERDFCAFCLDSRPKAHAIGDCGHSLMCTDCWRERNPHPKGERCRSDDVARVPEHAKWTLHRIFVKCPICRSDYADLMGPVSRPEWNRCLVDTIADIAQSRDQTDAINAIISAPAVHSMLIVEPFDDEGE